jgi:hypothetical protein
MAVVTKKRYSLRGRVRAQAQYARRLLTRLRNDYIRSGEVLPLATGLAEGSCPATYYTAIILQLETGLAEKT